MKRAKDLERLRALAAEWMELAGLPVMEERRDGWTALHSLRGKRPMILVEVGYINDYVTQDELLCMDPFCRRTEEYMLKTIRHAKEVGDDIVVEPYFRMGYSMEQPSFGVDVKMVESSEKGLAYVFEHTIKEPEDMKRLVRREFHIDRERTERNRAVLEEAFGDLLPVRLGNYDFMDEADGDYTWTGNCFFGLTWQLHRFIGLGELMYWFYDHPDDLHALLRYMTDDRLRMFRTLEKEKCLVPNTDNQMGGPCFYGYCDDLPKENGQICGLDSMWAWCESQESSSISAGMFGEFVLPYLAELAREFGLIYYGCCEPVCDRLGLIEKAIPNLRAVSVSMWNDFDVVGDLIGKKYVYSRKPAPPPMSGKDVNWEAAEKDLLLTKRSARDANLELLFRDLYDIGGERERLAKWVNLAKRTLGL